MQKEAWQQDFKLVVTLFKSPSGDIHTTINYIINLVLVFFGSFYLECTESITGKKKGVKNLACSVLVHARW